MFVEQALASAGSANQRLARGDGEGLSLTIWTSEGSLLSTTCVYFYILKIEFKLIFPISLLETPNSIMIT